MLASKKRSETTTRPASSAGRITPDMEKRFVEDEKKQLARMTRPAVQGFVLAKSIDFTRQGESMTANWTVQ